MVKMPKPRLLTRYRVITLSEACAHDAPALYGITDAETGCVVYVGKTKNLRKRMCSYTNAKFCHNGGLKGWLTEKGGLFAISLFNFGDDLDDAERLLIEKTKESIFNLVGGGVMSWHSHDSLPWMCGPGIRCPSDIALGQLLKVGGVVNPKTADSIRKIRSKMTVEQRCFYEARIGAQLPKEFSALFKKWWERVEHKMVEALESHALVNS